MKFQAEYRDPEKVKLLLNKIEQTITRPWQIMEVCGGQTHGLVKNGILDLLPEQITMIHGPGCPVCVTPLHLIDKAVYLAQQPDVIMCSYGDMIRVPGSEKSLLTAKAEGAERTRLPVSRRPPADPRLAPDVPDLEFDPLEERPVLDPEESLNLDPQIIQPPVVPESA